MCDKLVVENLTCELLENPMGMDCKFPRFSYVIRSEMNNIKQTGYRIQVAKDAQDFSRSDHMVWDSGKVLSDQSTFIPYQGVKLNPKTRYYYRVKVWDNTGRESEYSEIAYFETGFLDESTWCAKWITYDYEEKKGMLNPCPMLRKEFDIIKPVRKARLYITAKGLYEVYLNGSRVGDHYFTPGCTTYDKRIQYQVFDVTGLIKENQNAVGVLLGDGWYRGLYDRLHSDKREKLYLLFQMEIEHTDGTISVIATDDTFKSVPGFIRMSDFYVGETYDTTMLDEYWCMPGFNDASWYGTKIEDFDYDTIIETLIPAVRKMETIHPVEVIKTPEGDTVVDMGQNMVGWVSLEITGQYGDEITLHHAEVLDVNGNFYTANLLEAKQEVKYILNGRKQILEPHFTFQGFRYVKITGIKDIHLDQIKGIVLYSPIDTTGEFECSNPLVNQLQRNIQWGLKGNFVDIPSDCPQRNERHGWTGDAQVFIRTACFNKNVSRFFYKWLEDLKADQFENGAVTFVVPNVAHNGAGSSGWGDAATICPYTLYLCYGDKGILERQYHSMKEWVQFGLESCDEDYIWRKGFHFGDWLAKDWPWNIETDFGATSTHLVATAFLANSVFILKKTAGILGYKDDEQKYSDLYEKIKRAYNNEFVSPAGRIASDTQTAYVLSLVFHLMDEDMRKMAADRLEKDIKARGIHLSTGFLGTPYLCHVLSENGKNDIAYDLLLQESYPSWLYPVKKGATTIWERWDGIKDDGSFQSIHMNSFNHYAYGAIGDWLYRKVAGLNADGVEPGYKHILISPLPDRRFSYVKCLHKSLYGEIKIEWILKQDEFFVEVKIPVNTKATFINPFTDCREITVDGLDVSSDSEIVLGSGTYKILVKLP